jgi:hypothetical protein
MSKLHEALKEDVSTRNEPKQLNRRRSVLAHIHFYRKESVKETLEKIEPILSELQMEWHEILGSIQPLLSKYGVEIYVNETDTHDISCITITDGTPPEVHRSSHKIENES